jgi:hypothetical protein
MNLFRRMDLCAIDWTAFGTWMLVFVTWILAWIANRSVRDQRSAAKTQVAVRIHLDMEERFNSPAMLGARAKLAGLVLQEAGRDEITEAVPEFFESLAILDRLDYLLPDLTYNSFSPYALFGGPL